MWPCAALAPSPRAWQGIGTHVPVASLGPLHSRFRRGWNKNRVLATMRWRHSWQLRLARQEKWEATVQRTRERIHRDVAWQAWKDWRAAHQGQQGEQGQQALQQQGRPQPQGRPQQQSDAASFPPREPTLPAP